MLCSSSTEYKIQDLRIDSMSVVYLDQQAHAWACVCMVENDRKHSKNRVKVPFSACVREAHEEKRIKK